MMIRRPHAATATGFSLVELLIVLVILAVIAAVAYPSYMQQVRKSRRTDAKVALLDLAARQQRYFSMQNRFTGAPEELGYVPQAFPVPVSSGGQSFYDLRVVTARAGATFTATATPTGPQAADDCGTYVIDQLGRQSNTGLADSMTAATCW